MIPSDAGYGVVATDGVDAPERAREAQPAVVLLDINMPVMDGVEVRRHLYTEDGRLRSFVNVYLNDEDIRFLQKEQTPLNANDVITIVPSIAGGCARRCICR